MTTLQIVEVASLSALLIGAAILGAVELGLARRMREIKALFASALAHGASFDGALTEHRKRDDALSARLDLLTGRLEALSARVEELRPGRGP